MRAVTATDLPAAVGAIEALSVQPDGGVLLVDNNGQLLRVAPAGGEAVPVPVVSAGSPARVWHVTVDAKGKPWVVVTRPDGVRVAGAIPAVGAELAALELGKEPRRIAWAGGRLWFTATDTTLNVASAGTVAPAGGDRWNAVVASPDGTVVAARRVDTNDILVGRSDAPESWSVVRKRFGGQLAGVADDGTLHLLELGLWRVGEEPADSRLIRVSPTGTEQLLRTGPYLAAAVSGSHVALVRRATGKLVLETFSVSQAQ